MPTHRIGNVAQKSSGCKERNKTARSANHDRLRKNKTFFPKYLTSKTTYKLYKECAECIPSLMHYFCKTLVINVTRIVTLRLLNQIIFRNQQFDWKVLICRLSFSLSPAIVLIKHTTAIFLFSFINRCMDLLLNQVDNTFLNQKIMLPELF